ncbi:MAG: hypothetical protein AUI14_24095 [Actinobacteria bacterium 13_2_20CM_2_71_6]|nr:MAG: hypothetical protein AUI14_24095 [Actinobacteria bacterium 13_2_20CM_2_71_6]
MTVDETVESLSELGFSPYEARIYVALLQKSPMNGHEIGKHSGVPTSKVYETLERLRGKGAVRVYESDPVRYAPTPYRDLLSTFSDRMERTITKVSRSLATVAMDTDANLTWSITGAGNVVESLRNAVRNAKTRIRAVLDPPTADELAADLHAARERGVHVDVAPPLPGEDGRLCVVVGDDTETVVGTLGAGRAASGVWTHHAAVSLLARQHVEAAQKVCSPAGKTPPRTSSA